MPPDDPETLPAIHAEHPDWVRRFRPIRAATAPTFEPIAREILDQVSEDRGAAAVMKEFDFRQWIAVPGDLIDVGRPSDFGVSAELAVKDQVLALTAQSRAA